MEPRIFQLRSASIRPVSPTFSDWSPLVVPNLAHSNIGVLEHPSLANPTTNDDTSFPPIRRSFAFDEWDDEDKTSSNSSSDNQDESDDDGSYNPRCRPEVLRVIPTVDDGRIIYDATHDISRVATNQLPPLDTYMTVIQLDDTRLFESSFNSTEKGDKYEHPSRSSFPVILRHSETFNWGTDYSFLQQQNEKHSLHNQISFELKEGNRDVIGTAKDETSDSSMTPEQHPPIPEYIVVYKHE